MFTLRRALHLGAGACVPGGLLATVLTVLVPGPAAAGVESHGTIQ